MISPSRKRSAAPGWVKLSATPVPSPTTVILEKSDLSWLPVRKSKSTAPPLSKSHVMTVEVVSGISVKRIAASAEGAATAPAASVVYQVFFGGLIISEPVRNRDYWEAKDLSAGRWQSQRGCSLAQRILMRNWERVVNRSAPAAFAICSVPR